MSTTGAAKVMTAAGPVWCHFSKLAETRKLRRYSEGTAYEIEVEDDAVLEVVPLEQCKKLVAADSYGYENAAVWDQILRSLETGAAPPAGAGDPAERAPLVVPITALRQVYEVMKLFDQATVANMAAFFADAPGSLERLWNKSRKEFSVYQNADDWGRGVTEDLPIAPDRLSAVGSTNQFTAYLKAHPLEGYTFVDREISPRRTRRGFFSNKLPATKSGRGGVDLLLRSQTGFPVVGEVKVKDDKNAFYALVQGMTYAVELSTTHQLSRLKTHYAEAFGGLVPDDARVEILLVLVNPVEDVTRDSVVTLIRKINQRARCTGLDRIGILLNDGETWTSHW